MASTRDALAAIAVKDSVWAPGSTIFVDIIKWNGAHDVFTQEQIRTFLRKSATSWTRETGLTLIFGPTNRPADIRVFVNFEDEGTAWHSAQGWSAIGTSARRHPTHEHTMQLDIGRKADKKKCRGLMHHEFGHAVGLDHEHTHPNRPWTCFNVDAVYRDHGVDSLTGVARQKLEKKLHYNIMRPCDVNATILLSPNFDRLSVMVYRIDDTWVQDGHGVAEAPSKLSRGDRRAIRALYPPTKTLHFDRVSKSVERPPYMARRYSIQGRLEHHMSSQPVRCRSAERLGQRLIDANGFHVCSQETADSELLDCGCYGELKQETWEPYVPGRAVGVVDEEHDSSDEAYEASDEESEASDDESEASDDEAELSYEKNDNWDEGTENRAYRGLSRAVDRRNTWNGYSDDGDPEPSRETRRRYTGRSRKYRGGW